MTATQAQLQEVEGTQETGGMMTSPTGTEETLVVVVTAETLTEKARVGWTTSKMMSGIPSSSSSHKKCPTFKIKHREMTMMSMIMVARMVATTNSTNKTNVRKRHRRGQTISNTITTIQLVI